MLVVSRKESESIRIEPIEGLDPKLTLAEVFADRPIVVTVMHVGKRVRLVIDAPVALKIWRGPRADSHTGSTAAGPPAPEAFTPSEPAGVARRVGEGV